MNKNTNIALAFSAIAVMGTLRYNSPQNQANRKAAKIYKKLRAAGYTNDEIAEAAKDLHNEEIMNAFIM